MKHLALFILVTLTWNANKETDLAGYRVFYRPHSGAYLGHSWEGQATTCTIQVSDPGCFVARAFDTAGNESGNSDEVCVFSWADNDKDGDVDGNDLQEFGKEMGK